MKLYYLYTVICVFGIAVGQILFKLAANGFSKSGSYFDKGSLLYLFLALCLYGVTTIGWVWILKHLSLVRAYPFMALAFVIVPLLAMFFLGENISFNYLLGALLIVCGIILTFI